MGARKHTGWKDIASLPSSEQYKWADERIAVMNQRSHAPKMHPLPKIEKLPTGHMRGLFGVWWYKGIRFEKNFLGRYVLQDSHDFSSISAVMDYIDSREEAMGTDMKRFGKCWPIRDSYGWQALKESEPEPKPIEADFWVVLVTPFLIGTICGWLMF